MKIFSWTNIRLVLIFAILIFLWSFSNIRNSNRNCTGIKLSFVGEHPPLIKFETINELLKTDKKRIKEVVKNNVDVHLLENKLNKHPLVDTAEVFLNVRGQINAKILQKKPLARYFGNGASCYLDLKGEKMPLSENYSSRLVFVEGNYKNVKKEKFANLLNKIATDSFLKKNIIGIEIKQGGSLLMHNRNFEFQINFGRLMNEDMKFKNYKAFFQKAVLDSSLFKYKIIDLRFTQQVVCTK